MYTSNIYTLIKLSDVSEVVFTKSVDTFVKEDSDNIFIRIS